MIRSPLLIMKKSPSKPKTPFISKPITPLVKSLIGVIVLPADYDYKKDYGDYLARKYMK